jgi:ATP-dependent Lhr-like helicase
LRDAWPDPRNPDELLDALDVLGFMTEAEANVGNLQPLFQQLHSKGRALRFELGAGLWVSRSRLAEHRAGHPNVRFSSGETPKAATVAGEVPEFEIALREILRSRLEALGPVTAAELAASYSVGETQVSHALLALEGEGVIFQGFFRAPTARHPAGDTAAREWCERRLLARIHRATLERLRSEIEPVTQQTFLRFLLRWQRLEPGEHAAGPGGTAQVLEQLEGYEAAAGAWESELLRARIDNYEPAWLDTLCLSGRLRWLRRTPSASGHTALKTTPIALVPRVQAPLWQQLGATPGEPTPLSADAERLRAVLAQSGASFFEDVERATGLLRSRAEAAMSELVARGLVTSDSYAGVRALLGNASKHGARGSQSRLSRVRRAAGLAAGFDSAGRWTLLQPSQNPEHAALLPTSVLTQERPIKSKPPEDRPLEDNALEYLARVLLRRWGVVFRALLERESELPPWRDLLRCYRRLESRGEIRGGRFVAGFSGEQYALPDAITSLRAVKRSPLNGSTLVISAADPLNLVGIITPGRRVASLPSHRILLRDGVPTACREGSAVRVLQADTGAQEAPPPAREDVELLTRRSGPAAPWLGRGATRSLVAV